MIDELNILELIKNSENGPIEMEKPMYVHLYDKDKGEINKKKYMCSMIISIVKYNERKIHVSFLDLPKSYKGEDIDLINDTKHSWHYMTMNPIKLASLKGSFSWEDFK